MLELIIVGGVLFLIFKGGQLNLNAAVSPVIRNATGGSLSAALGSTSSPPSQYATGQTGYAYQNSSVATPNTHLAGTSATLSPQPAVVAQQPALPLNRTNFFNRTPSAAHNNVVYATGVRPNTNVPATQAPPLVVAPSKVIAFNPATQKPAIINPAITQGVVSTARNSPEVASPFWSATIKTRKIATY